MLCGLGIPSLRLSWGAVRNRQLCILHTNCIFVVEKKVTCLDSEKKKYTTLPQKKITHTDHFFQWSVFFTTKKITPLYRKKKKSRTYRIKKLHPGTVFWDILSIFHVLFAPCMLSKIAQRSRFDARQPPVLCVYGCTDAHLMSMRLEKHPVPCVYGCSLLSLLCV